MRRTPSGGYHLVFVCEPDERNAKLAVAENGNAAIETRASGGYFLIAPSEGYEIVYGNIGNIPTISPDERDELFSVARSFDTRSREKLVYGTSELPGDDYDSKADVPELLRSAGLDARRRELLAQARQIAGDFRDVEPYPEQVFRVFEFDGFRAERRLQAVARLRRSEMRRGFSEGGRRAFVFGIW